MRALLAFTGSRGDAQPGILLARALRERGHEVTLALAPNLVPFAEAHGIAAVPYGYDSAALLLAQRTDTRFGARDPLARLRATIDLQRRGVPEMVRDLRFLVPGHDVVVAGMAGEEAAAATARAHGLPFAALHFFPIQPNAAVPVVPARWARRLPGAVHRLGWTVLTGLRAAALAPVLPRAEADTATLRIQAYDPDLFPGLRTEIQGPFTGFPTDRDGLLRPHADPELDAWLDAGSAPVYVGFGSMDVGDPREFAAMLREVCARRGRRLLLASGWSPLTPGIDDEVAVVPHVDHAAVLPRCVTVVHHGGAGTTAAALKAGVPQVICSVQADQPYWGAALRDLGLAATARAKDLTGDRLTDLLDRVADPEIVLRAAAYATDYTDDGVDRAADAVAALAAPTPSPRSLR
ncbi:nucleotide disphospho-sugar-binding domain-containing protein [Nocardia sp. AG03]|uniref:glycosyltransferase n=1 Tax=Nocardia sp. AG03 TaxID=3025312 RepID=UPI0024185A13|nr:nucleotide disphospho-sugar-binding domain-containing protein [Nocardia sp. AG03]